jgi:hypothetical protein
VTKSTSTNQGGRSFQSPSARTGTVRRTAGLKQPRVDGLHERPAETLESNRLIVAGMIASSSATIASLIASSSMQLQRQQKHREIGRRLELLDARL